MYSCLEIKGNVTFLEWKVRNVKDYKLYIYFCRFIRF